MVNHPSPSRPGPSLVIARSLQKPGTMATPLQNGMIYILNGNLKPWDLECALTITTHANCHCANIYLSIHLFIYLSLSICLSVYLSIYLYIYLSIYIHIERGKPILRSLSSLQLRMVIAPPIAFCWGWFSDRNRLSLCEKP